MKKLLRRLAFPFVFAWRWIFGDRAPRVRVLRIKGKLVLAEHGGKRGWLELRNTHRLTPGDSLVMGVDVPPVWRRLRKPKPAPVAKVVKAPTEGRGGLKRQSRPKKRGARR